MQYVMLNNLDENSITEQQRAQCYVDSANYARQLQAEGRCLAVASLHPTVTATSIRRREGKPVITDGLFAESREQLGGSSLLMPPTWTKPSISARRFLRDAGAPSKCAQLWKFLGCLCRTESVDLVDSRSTYQ